MMSADAKLAKPTSARAMMVANIFLLVIGRNTSYKESHGAYLPTSDWQGPEGTLGCSTSKGNAGVSPVEIQKMSNL
jgi:hypothetical protein